MPDEEGTMRSRTPDIEPDEERFAEEVGAAFTEMRARHAACPDPAMVLAAEAGTLPEETAAAVFNHLAQCAWCRRLRADMADPELLRLDADAARRIRARVLTSGAELPHASRWLEWTRPRMLLPLGVVMVAVVAVATGIFVNRTGPTVKPGPTAATPTAAPPANGSSLATPSSALRLEKAPVKLPLGAVILRRGETGSDRDRLLSDLRPALVPYRDDNFARAAAMLDVVARKHPTSPEPRFYLGVCRLFLNENDQAATDLEDALRLARGEQAEDAAWYSSLAYQRLGKTEQAVNHLRRLCEGHGGYAERACTAIAEIHPSTPAVPKK